jgi:hypothetical protein
MPRTRQLKKNIRQFLKLEEIHERNLALADVSKVFKIDVIRSRGHTIRTEYSDATNVIDETLASDFEVDNQEYTVKVESVSIK